MPEAADRAGANGAGSPMGRLNPGQFGLYGPLLAICGAGMALVALIATLAG